MNHFYTLMAKSLAGSGGKPPTLIEKSITNNGEYTAASDEADGYSKVNVNVQPSLATKAITANGTYTAASDNADGYSEVTVNVQSGGGATGSEIVRFIDYDGTVLHTYTKDQFLALTEMPANPTHTGLTAQGWNYSISDAKDHVTKYGSLDIGQMYITDDGKTRIHIHLEEGRLNPKLTINLNGSCIVDWGDGSNTDTITGNNAETSSVHTYSTGGDYIITLDITGTFSFIGDSTTGSKLMNHATTNVGNNNRVYQNSVLEVFIGSNMTSVGETYAFQNCYSLISVVIPEGVTSIGQNAFHSCYSLTSVIIPEGVTSIGIGAFTNCYSLTSVTIPDTVTSIEPNTFSNCYSLTSVTIPEGVTSIGQNAFSNCYSLTSVTIPEGVTSIGIGAFNSCSSLISVTIPEGVTFIGNSAFSSCSSLTSVTIPEGVTSIGQNAFQSCYSLISIAILDTVTSIKSSIFYNCVSLTSVTIPDTVTSIGQSAFKSCYSLTSVIIPETVTSISASAFDSCYGLGFIKFERSTPPTVSSSNTFTSVPRDCIIYVPAGSLTAYTSATNYPNPNTYTYVEY